ncbi:MAG: hypothetical protein E4H14_06810 [Candidatus Thorarchaeota archaeon]|nr:MAG: hypothetical protein E4H14_06810 [Candidatus Thorarchaeota archaeon]
MKKQLGIDELQVQVDTLQERKKELEEERDSLVVCVTKATETTEKLNEELGIYRKREEADKAKYESTEPWVEIRSADFHAVRGFRIELDWNEAFVQHLKDGGMKGANDEELVQKWIAFLYHDLVEKLESKSVDIKDAEKTISDYA